MRPIFVCVASTAALVPPTVAHIAVGKSILLGLGFFAENSNGKVASRVIGGLAILSAEASIAGPT